MIPGLFVRDVWREVYRTGRNRIAYYGRWRRLYENFAIRYENYNSANPQYKIIKHNPAYGIVNIGAEFLAGGNLKFQIANNPELSQMANDIWQRSGGNGAFMEAAVTGSICGDAVIMLGYNPDDEIILKWLDPAIAYPIFDWRDYTRITEFVVAFQSYAEPGGWVTFYEQWKDGTIYRTEKDVENPKPIGSYDMETYGGEPPVVWIRNLSIKGDMFGRSDVAPVEELVIQYDHLMSKESSTIDYYAQPNIFMKGVRKPDIMVKDQNTVYFLPSDGDIGFVEWKGTPPSVHDHIERLRDDISEITSTPKIAFSNFNFTSSDISGVALKVLFGPLLKKTERKRNQTWGPGICKAMWMALRELGHDVNVEDIVILWPDPLPNNTKEGWEQAVMQDLLGVSHAQIQRERGYTEVQIEQMAKEQEAEKKREIDLEIYKAKALAEIAAENQQQPTQGSPGGGPKRMSAKEKTDHKTKSTPGKISGVDVTGRKGAI